MHDYKTSYKELSLISPSKLKAIQINSNNYLQFKFEN